LLGRLHDHADDATWRIFHAKYGQLLYRYARARGASEADAEDVVQEVITQFVHAMPGFRYDPSRGRFRGYLRAAVIREMARQGRRSGRQPVAMGSDLVESLAIDPAATDEAWRVEWWLNSLREAVDQIADEFDPVTLKAFEMHVLAAVPAAETSEKLGISRWRIYRSRRQILRRLRTVLGAPDSEDFPRQGSADRT
jgi:RNA polymerase sigma-70 factor (ECF subfamily)